MISRRTLLMGAVAVSSCANLPGEPTSPLSTRMGVQLYVLSAEVARDLPGTMRRVREIGYREVEGSLPRGVTPQTFRVALDEAELRCPSLHILFDAMVPGSVSLAEPDRVIEAARTIGATNAVIGVFPFMDTLMRRSDAQPLLANPSSLGPVILEIARAMSAEDRLAFARRLNENGARLAAQGIRLGYHNHNVEFIPLGNGRPALELLIAETDARYVDFELDLGWAKSAGEDPAALIRQHAGRVRQVHLKDLLATPANHELQLNTAEVGRGVQNWDEIAEALKSARVEHAYVEQEPPYEAGGLQMAANSYAYLQPIFARHQA